MSWSRSFVNVAGKELDLVVERADHALVLRQQAEQELLGGLLEQLQVARHARAGVEHHDDRDRLHFVDEQID